MRILYFAWLRERLGMGQEECTLPDDVTTVAELVTWLKSRSPRHEAAFADMSSVRVALDQTHGDWGDSLAGISEVAFFPPVTGG